MYITRDPHVDLRMFAKHRNLSVGGGVNLIVGAIGYSVTALVAYLELAVGATPTDAGAAVLVRVLTYAIGVPLAFYLLVLRQALDTRAIVRIGVIGTSLLLFAFAQSMTSTAEMDTFVGLSLAFGLFFGLMNQPLGALVIGSLPLQLLASGIAIYKLSSPLGSMIATGVMQTVFDHNSAAIQTRLAGDMVRGRPVIASYIQNHHGKAEGLTSLVVTQGHILAFASTMEILAVALLVVFPLVQLAQVKRPERKVRN
jgi:DHA2 family multidrug resistance protein